MCISFFAAGCGGGGGLRAGLIFFLAAGVGWVMMRAMDLADFVRGVWWGTAALTSLSAAEVERTWTSYEGKTIVATLVDTDGTTARLRLGRGVVTTVPWSRLSREDQQYLAEWRERRPPSLARPDVVGVEPSGLRVETVLEDEAGGRFVYRTPHFEFESEGRLAGSLAGEVARSFEATYELLRALPWSVDPRPAEGRYFRASLFRTMEGYHEAGGLPGSAGSYFSHQRRLMVPFESMGISAAGREYRMDETFDTHILVHELTHQMMHFWLGLLPQWVVEGVAEYAGRLPFRGGKFRVSEAEAGLKEYVAFRKKRVVGGVPEPYPLDKLFSMTSEEWKEMMASDNSQTQRLYMTSYLLVFYFMHFDGRGDGERFVRYMHASSAPCRQMEAYERELASYNDRVRGNWPEGRARDGDDREGGDREAPPAMPRQLFFGAAREQILQENLQLLLDGRTEAQLMEEVRAAYLRLGVTL